METTGQIIRKSRKASNMTQLELSKKLGYDSMQFVSLVERGLSKPPHEFVGKCCKILNIPVNVMIRRIQKEKARAVEAEIMAGYEK